MVGKVKGEDKINGSRLENENCQDPATSEELGGGGGINNKNNNKKPCWW